MRALLASLRLAFASLLARKARAALTALGILIGIAAVVVVTALGTGARARIGGQIESMGSNLLFVFSMPVMKSGAKGRAGAQMGLTDADADAIRREAAAVTAVTVYSEVSSQIVSEFGNAKIGVMGVDHDYFPVRGYEVANGRAWTLGEEQVKSKVCLIGRTAAGKLFGNVDPVGRYLRIGRHPYLVIGTLVPKGESPFEDQDDRIIMPIGSWRARVSPTLGNRVMLIMASARSTAYVGPAARQIDAILRQRHGIIEGEESDFKIRTQQEFQKTQEAIFGVLTLLLVSVAGIALFVGAVGVMNIMLVSVTERTREIGIRMAIGARRGDIQLQFLAEAVALTLGGGVAGLALAAGLIFALGRALDWELALSATAVWIALGTSVVIGVASGFLPARRAAALDPIEALRHE
ncbi:MAG: ABC transporter permease [Sorangiineae bacterium]|nr:ABC transporter permease [Polyangiaceae bacterium]MEB2324658.1 ABC transporter permease [Sorangiineae bacterium]